MASRPMASVYISVLYECKYESIWRKTRHTVHFDMYSESCMAVKKQLVRVNMLYCKRKFQDAMVIRRSFSKLLTPC